MRSYWAVWALVVAGVAGCNTVRTPELNYLPPSGPPANERTAFVQQRAWLVWGNILDRLQQQDVRVVEVDEAAGEFAVEYTGNPEPYVDCGWIVSHRGETFDRLPAAAPETHLRRKRGGRAVTLERDMNLRALVKVTVEPRESDTFVRADSSYELTKTISSPAAEQPLHTETIRFDSGQSATFVSGTTCQPTGQLEHLVFEALPAVSIAGS